MPWPSFMFIGDADDADDLAEQLRNAHLNDAYEDLAGDDDFAAQWDAEADEARERTLAEQEGG